MKPCTITISSTIDGQGRIKYYASIKNHGRGPGGLTWGWTATQAEANAQRLIETHIKPMTR